jgi:CheY-like chemotaxis protein
MPSITTRPKDIQPPGPGAGRLLVVDDDWLIATAIERSLNTHYNVVCVRSAQAALAFIAAGEEFDVILCDLMMPDMTGMDLHAALEALNPRQAERIIFVSGGAFTARTRDFLARVPNTYLEKPFDMFQLRTLINQRIRAKTLPE